MPSRVAEILMEQGRAAARARELSGQIWGGTVARLGEIPLELQQRQHELRLEQQREREQARREKVTEQQLQVGAFELAQAQRGAADQTLVASVWADPEIFTATGINRASVLEKLRTKAPHLIPHFIDVFDKMDASQTATAEKARALETHHLDMKGELAQRLREGPNGIDPNTFHLVIADLARTGALPTEEANQLLALRTPEEIMPHLQHWELSSPKLRAEAIAAKREAEKPLVVAPEATIIRPGLPGTEPQVIARGAPKEQKPPPIEEQLLEAITKGDRLTVARITETMRTKALASRDPEAAATLNELRTLNVEAARERLRKLRDESGEGLQRKLEQQYRQVLQRGLSSRSGGLGLEDSKVQQANHLMALMDQGYDAKTKTYNIPAVMQEELALGLARLTSPTGQVGVELAAKLNQPTAYGKMQAIITYVTGTPQAGSTQAVFKMFRDSIKRQGEVAQINREAEMRYLRNLAPTDLEETRRQKLDEASLGPLRALIPDGTGDVAEFRDGKWIRVSHGR